MTARVSLEARQAAALIKRRLLIQRLRSLNSSYAQSLADILDECNATVPCRSAACPVCGIDFQLATVALQEKVIGVPARAIRHRKHALTIVPCCGCVPPNDLSLGVYQSVRRVIAAAFTACDLPPILFALDISFNEDSTERLPPHWCVHGDGIGLDNFPKRKAKALRDAFPKSSFVSRPVFAQDLDSEDEALLYAYKPERVRRITLPKRTAESGRSYQPKPKRDELRAWQTTKLALVEHAAGYRGRLIGHKVDQSAIEQLLQTFKRRRDGT